MSSSGNIATSRMLTDSVDMHGVCIGGVEKVCLGTLGSAPIDKNGTLIPLKSAPPLTSAGAGGGNDIASGAREVVVVTKQKKDRFMEQVSYISCAGTNVTTLISNLGFLKRTAASLN